MPGIACPANPTMGGATKTSWAPRPDHSGLRGAWADQLATWELPGRAKSVGVARAFLRLVLGPDDPQAETAQWLLSELFTNSVIHSRSGSHVHGMVGVTVWRCQNGCLLVEVVDDGGGTGPHADCGDLLAESGRGWQLVQSVARSCGSTTSGMSARTTWFTLAGIGRADSSRSRQACPVCP